MYKKRKKEQKKERKKEKEKKTRLAQVAILYNMFLSLLLW